MEIYNIGKNDFFCSFSTMSFDQNYYIMLLITLHDNSFFHNFSDI